VKAEELYDKYRSCGEAYWLELTSDERERWERIHRAVEKAIDDAYLDGWNAGEYGD
jgi:hypothetical protein